jgi:hypothetical protein
MEQLDLPNTIDHMLSNGAFQKKPRLIFWREPEGRRKEDFFFLLLSLRAVRDRLAQVDLPIVTNFVSVSWLVVKAVRPSGKAWNGNQSQGRGFNPGIG